MENGGLREQNHIILLTFVVELSSTRTKRGNARWLAGYCVRMMMHQRSGGRANDPDSLHYPFPRDRGSTRLLHSAHRQEPPEGPREGGETTRSEPNPGCVGLPLLRVLGPNEDPGMRPVRRLPAGGLHLQDDHGHGVRGTAPKLPVVAFFPEFVPSPSRRKSHPAEDRFFPLEPSRASEKAQPREEEERRVHFEQKPRLHRPRNDLLRGKRDV